MPNNESFYAILIQKLPSTIIFIFSKARNHYEVNYIIEMQNVMLMRRYLCLYNTHFLGQNYSVK